MKRIVFVGAAGSGKSTLSTAVYSALKQAGRRVEHVDEFIRRDIQAHGPMSTIWEQYRTRQFQKELEDAVPATDYVVCDSGTLTPYFYAVLYADPATPRQRLVIQDMYKYLLDDLYLQRYELVFYLPLLGGINLNDGTRYQTEEQIKVLDQHMGLVFTKLHRLPNVHSVDSGYDKRFEEVMWKILGADYLTLHSQTATMHFSSTGDAIQNY